MRNRISHRITSRITPLILTLLLTITGSTAIHAQAPDIDIPYQKFTLDNGLRVVVHEDRKAPVVAVSVWYHVGSKDEKPGKTGFAHLFEHLMFNGSENYNDEYFIPFEQVGATGMNGTTWFDRTNYFETVPTPALDMALWMESDRMGHLLGVIDQTKLDEQRGVVQNEKRQGDNQPYGLVEYRVLEGLFPEGHPYRWSTIGSLEDLNAASVEDVHEWFKAYYGAANTVLVLAGDIDAETARPLVEKYFGDIAAGPPLTRRDAWVPKLPKNVLESMHDQVPQTRIYRNWAVPGRITAEADQLSLAATILGGGRTSRLYQKLVQELQLATSARVSLQRQELASMFELQVTLQPGVSETEVLPVIDTELQRFMQDGPTTEEVSRAQTRINAGVIRGLEQVGGFGGKAVALARGELYAGDPGFFLTSLQRINEAKAKQLRDTTREWLNSGYYQITVHPFPEYSTVETNADRSQLPQVGPLPDLEFPEVERGQLRNGMPVVFARRDAVPVVEVQLSFDAGYAADTGGVLGTASFATAMLNEGTENRTSLEISSEAESLGANIGASSGLDTTQISLSALTSNLDDSVELYADVVRNPAFRDADIDLLRKRWLAQIQQEKAQPLGIALRTLPPLLYGDQHAYGIPFTGSGTEDSINQLTSDTLSNFHRDWLRPDNGVVFVVGDTTLADVTKVLNKHLGDWQGPRNPVPTKQVAQVADVQQAKVYVIDKPGASQTVILGGQLAPPTGTPDNLAIVAMNEIIGGIFTSRINMNLREDKGWAYGAFTFMSNAKGQRPWVVYAPVQTDKTRESILEIQKELDNYLLSAPATEDELQKVKNNNTNSLPGQFETAGAVLGALQNNHIYNRPADYIQNLTNNYRALNLEQVQAKAGDVLHPDRLIWVIVGDRSEIDAGLAEMNLGEIQYLDEDGNPKPD